jgi:hypothetical protein
LVVEAGKQLSHNLYQTTPQCPPTPAYEKVLVSYAFHLLSITLSLSLSLSLSLKYMIVQSRDHTIRLILTKYYGMHG